MCAQIREYSFPANYTVSLALRENGRDNHPLFFESADVGLGRELCNGGVTLLGLGVARVEAAAERVVIGSGSERLVTVEDGSMRGDGRDGHS